MVFPFSILSNFPIEIKCVRLCACVFTTIRPVSGILRPLGQAAEEASQQPAGDADRRLVPRRQEPQRVVLRQPGLAPHQLQRSVLAVLGLTGKGTRLSHTPVICANKLALSSLLISLLILLLLLTHFYCFHFSSTGFVWSSSQTFWCTG